MNRKNILIFTLFLIACFTSTAQVKEGKVEMYNGRPALFVNGVPELPVFYALTHAYGGRWSWEEVPSRNIKLFSDAGVKLFQADLYMEDIWFKDKKELDLTKAFKQVRGFTDINPEARVVIRIHVNAPYWWNEANREECTGFADGPIDSVTYGPPRNLEDGDIDRPLRASLASLKWRKEAGERLAEFCKKMAASPEGNHVIGIHVAGGVFGEWHYWGYPKHDPDNGPAMTNYFRSWLIKKYKSDQSLQKAWNNTRYTLKDATVPDTAERNATNGILRNPSKEQRVIDYFTCQQEVVADDIEYFCRIVKETWPRNIITGVFYGYFHMTFSRQASGGHLFVERILKSPYIDYLSAPQSYHWMAYDFGGPGFSRGIIESAIINKKLWLDEVDNGWKQKIDYSPTRTDIYADTQFVAMTRRSALMPLTRGIGFWYYDFGLTKSRGWWDHPVYQKNIKEEIDYFGKSFRNPFKNEADVLMVYDMESFYYLHNKWTALSEDIPDVMAAEVFKTGATTDEVYLFDLPKINLEKYKVVIFFNCFKMKESDIQFVKSKVATNGRTLIYTYLPAYTDGITSGLKRTSALTGFKMEKTNFNGKPSYKTLNNIYPDTKYDFMSSVYPLFKITDDKAEPILALTHSNDIVAAKKVNKDHTVILGILPIHNPLLLQKIFKDAGVHIYNEDTDVTVCKSGVIWIHTKEGGPRTLNLKNGKKVTVTLPAKSTTIYNGETGKKIF